jgi:hypothetical protein
MDPQIALQHANRRIAELHWQAAQERLASLARKSVPRTGQRRVCDPANATVPLRSA